MSYELKVSDKETVHLDGNLVSLQGEFRNRRYLTDTDAEFSTPGLALMRKSTCFACHISDAPSAGPSYELVAKKYETDPSAPERLAQKVLQGGVGVWGQLPMPPHPQHNIEQSRQMVGWILSLNKNKLKKIIPATYQYQKEMEQVRDIRIDYVFVNLKKNKPIIKHFEGIRLE